MRLNRADPWWGPRRPPVPAPKAEPEPIEWVVLPMPDQSAIIWPEPAPEFLPPPRRLVSLEEMLNAWLRAFVERMTADPDLAKLNKRRSP